MLLIKYYSFIIIFYIIEITLFFLLKDFYENIVLLNISIRSIFVIFSSSILKKMVFKESRYFYHGYYFIAAINPFISSLILFVMIYFFHEGALILKFLADLITSFLSFYLLKKL